MNLRDKYNQLFNGKPKSNDQALLKEGIWMTGITTGKRTVKEADDRGHLTAEDFGYFQDRVDKLYDQLADLEQEIGTAAEMAAEETGYKAYEEITAQTSRYLVATQKQLDALKKYLSRTATRISNF